MAKTSGIVNSLVTTYRFLRQRGWLMGQKGYPIHTTPILPADQRSAQIEGNVRNQTVTTAGYDVWEDGLSEIPRPSAAGETFAVVSDEVEDNATGIGIQEIGIDLILIDGTATTVYVEMNGKTEVVIPGTYIFVNDIFSSRNFLKANGNYSTGAGEIKVYQQGNPTSRKYALIRPGGNKSLTCTRYVPKGFNYLIEMVTPSGDTKGVEGIVRATNTDTQVQVNGFLFKVPFQLEKSGIPIIFPTPLQIMEHSLVKATLFSISGNVQGVTVSIVIAGRLVPINQ